MTVKTLKRIETHKAKGCSFCPSCSHLSVSEFLILEDRNNSLCFLSPALKRLGVNEGNGAYHKSAPPCTASSPRELFLFWGIYNNIWKKCFKICKERQKEICGLRLFDLSDLAVMLKEPKTLKQHDQFSSSLDVKLETYNPIQNRAMFRILNARSDSNNSFLLRPLVPSYLLEPLSIDSWK